MPRFLTTIPPDEARRVFASLAEAAPLPPVETVPLAAALGRVLAVPFAAPEDLPAFDRAVMDGYAVRAADTFGASESCPAYVRLVGRVAMGEVRASPLGPGEAVEISTGGTMPPGADAVVMVEHAREAAGQVEIGRAAAPGDHVIRAGDDLRAGAELLPAGVRLGPAQLAALAAFGAGPIPVRSRPRVGIVSTGDELVPAEARPPPGKVRDVNAAALAAQVIEAGGQPRPYGIVPDDAARLGARVEQALAECDAVLVSGGSSQGARDLTAAVLGALGPPGVLAHGIAVAPGKPTILAAAGARPLLGMPGHPVTSMVIFRVFVAALVRRLGGERGACEPFPARWRARLSRTMPSRPGREEYLRVKLREEGGETWADPLLGGSAALATVARADGLVCIPLAREGLAAGEVVEVLLW